MRLGGLAKTGRGRRRIENSLSEGTLTFDRETDDLGFLDRALGSLLGRRNNEIADAAPLNLRRPLDDRQRVGGDARLDASRANWFMGHKYDLSLCCLQMYGITPDKERGTSSALKNQLEAAVDQSFAVEGHGPSRLHARVGHHLLGSVVAHGARRPDDPRKYDRFVLFAFDRHGERGDLAFRDIIAPTLDYFQRAVLLEYGRRPLGEFYVSFAVGLGHRDHKTIDVGHDSLLAYCGRLPAILSRSFRNGSMLIRVRAFPSSGRSTDRCCVE